VLVTGIVLSFRTDPGIEQYVIAGLAGLGALLSSYLGKIFFEGQPAAMEQLNFYYAEPSLTGRVLAAERIAENMVRKPQATYAKEFVRMLLTWEPPQPPAQHGLHQLNGHARKESANGNGGEPKGGVKAFGHSVRQPNSVASDRRNCVGAVSGFPHRGSAAAEPTRTKSGEAPCALTRRRVVTPTSLASRFVKPQFVGPRAER
jgi:hypothetical protein